MGKIDIKGRIFSAGVLDWYLIMKHGFFGKSSGSLKFQSQQEADKLIDMWFSNKLTYHNKSIDQIRTELSGKKIEIIIDE